MGFFGNLFSGGAGNYNPVINQASGLEKTGANNANTLFGESQSLSGLLAPFFGNELSNPQGLGATTMSQMLTSTGQSVAGGVGAARGRALDLAARTGNTAAIPAGISAATKQGIATQADAARDVATKNAMLKLNQQQEGAAGLSGLFKTDIGESSDFMKNAIGALSPELDATKDKTAAQQQGLSRIFGGVQGIGDALSGIIPGAGSIGTIASLFT